MPERLAAVHVAVLKAALDGGDRAALAAVAAVPEEAVDALLRVAVAKFARVLAELP